MFYFSFLLDLISQEKTEENFFLFLSAWCRLRTW